MSSKVSLGGCQPPALLMPQLIQSSEPFGNSGVGSLAPHDEPTSRALRTLFVTWLMAVLPWPVEVEASVAAGAADDEDEDDSE
jgi:hypothetical protein